MKTARIKAPAILNRAAFDLTVDTIASATTRLRELEALRDAEIQKAQGVFATEIGEVQKQIELAASMCEKYAEAHREELLPGKAKSTETTLARFGFRLGNRTLKPLSKWTWEKVLRALLDEDLDKEDCVRTKHEVDKEIILRLAADDTNLVIPDADEPIIYPLSQFGLKIAQAETFFIEPKVDGADTIKAGGGS